MSDPVVVPWQDLAADTLEAMVEEFVTRDGTDYGEQEASLASKVSQVKRSLELGEYLIVYFPADQSVNIISKREWLSY